MNLVPIRTSHITTVRFHSTSSLACPNFCITHHHVRYLFPLIFSTFFHSTSLFFSYQKGRYRKTKRSQEDSAAKVYWKTFPSETLLYNCCNFIRGAGSSRVGLRGEMLPRQLFISLPRCFRRFRKMSRNRFDVRP